MAEKSDGAQIINDIYMKDSSTDVWKYSIFSEITSLDIFNYAAKAGAENFFIFINPEQQGVAFPVISSIGLARIFDSTFSNKIAYVRFNKTRALVVNTNDKATVCDIVSRKEILGIPVSTKIALDNLITKIIVRQVKVSNSITEVVEDIESRNNIKILAARRLLYKGTPTNKVLLTIAGHYLYDEINCEYMKCPVKQFIERPTQCKGCYKFGHIQSKCTGEAICANCGTKKKSYDEEKKEIIHDEEKCTEINCINCEETHKSNDQNCSEYIKNDQIIKLSKQKNIPKFEATRIFYSEGKKPTYAKILVSRNDQQYNIEFPEIVKEIKEDIKAEIRELFSEFKENQDKKFEEFVNNQEKKLDEIKKEIKCQNSKETQNLNNLKIEEYNKDQKKLREEIDKTFVTTFQDWSEQFNNVIEKRLAKEQTTNEPSCRMEIDQASKKSGKRKNEDEGSENDDQMGEEIEEEEANDLLKKWHYQENKLTDAFYAEIRSIDCKREKERYAAIAEKHNKIREPWIMEIKKKYRGRNKDIDRYFRTVVQAWTTECP